MLSGTIQVTARDARVTSTDALQEVGTLAHGADGSLYRYAKAGASDLDPGKLCVAATQEANHANIGVAAAAAAGDKEVSVTLGATAVTANAYANGYLVVNDADGEGVVYRISGHLAADASATLVVNLKDEVEVALTTSSEVSLVKNPWQDIVVAAVDQADRAVGVPEVTIGDTEYGWVKTRGICSVLADEAVSSPGTALTIGSAVAGAVEAADAAGEQVIGYAFQALVDTEYRAVDLQID